jgi:hypothetical protein
MCSRILAIPTKKSDSLLQLRRARVAKTKKEQSILPWIYATFCSSYQIAEYLKRTECHSHQLSLQFQFNLVRITISGQINIIQSISDSIFVSNRSLMLTTTEKASG